MLVQIPFRTNLYKIPEMSLAKLSFNSRALSILVCWTRKWLRVGVKTAVTIKVEIGVRVEVGVELG